MASMRRLLIGLVLAGMAGAVSAAPVNINQADAGSIAEALKGIGDVKAEAIVAHREANGPFESVDGLTAVDGIGPGTLEQIRDDVRLKEDEEQGSW